jgi:hypothetical protein
MACKLLELPAELRVMIWQYALTNSFGSIQYDGATRCFDVSSIGAGLLFSCRSISSETVHLPLLLNTIVIDLGTVEFVDFSVQWTRLEDLAAKHGLVPRIKLISGRAICWMERDLGSH